MRISSPSRKRRDGALAQAVVKAVERCDESLEKES
jgi:hypothetical protein